MPFQPAACLTRRALDKSVPLYAAACLQWSGVNLLARSIAKGHPGRLTMCGFNIFGTMAPTLENFVALDTTRTSSDGMPGLILNVRHPPEAATTLVAGERSTWRRCLTAAKLRPHIRRWFIDAVGGAVHFAGTCRMHASPQFGMLDKWSRLHAVQNVVVADSAAFTTGPGEESCVDGDGAGRARGTAPRRGHAGPGCLRKSLLTSPGGAATWPRRRRRCEHGIHLRRIRRHPLRSEARLDHAAAVLAHPRRSAGSRNSERMFTARFSTSPCRESRPHLPCSTTSRVPPFASATTGRFMASASANTRPKGSSSEGKAKMSHAAMTAGISDRCPVKMTCSETPSSAASAFSSAVKLVFIACRSSRPMMSTRTSGNSARTEGSARISSSWPLPRNRRAADAITGVVGAIPNSRRMMLGSRR